MTHYHQNALLPCKKNWRWLVLLLLVFLLANVHAKDKLDELKKLNQTLSALKKKQHIDLKQQSQLDKQLEITEKSIGQLNQKIEITKKDISLLEKQLDTLKIKEERLTKIMEKQYQELSQHLTSLYQFGNNYQIKMLLSLHSPTLASRFNTYFYYLSNARIAVIKKLVSNQSALENTQKHYQEQATKLARLQADNLIHQAQLKKQLMKHKVLYQQIAKQLKSRQIKIQQTLKNKEKLEAVLKKIHLTKRPCTPLPFPRMSHKLTWPAKGLLDDLYGQYIGDSELTYNGIRILAPLNRKVVAIYPGTIVFSDWLKGFGLLLIIDHGYGYLSLYAHGNSLLKSKGDTVQTGEPIALIGHSGGEIENALYFEIRHLGKPVNPLLWLKPTA